MKCHIANVSSLALLLTALGAAHATPLSTLFGGGTMTAGDKLFDKWGLVSATTSDGHVVNTGNIDVTTLGPSLPNPLDPGPGLRFNMLNNELRVFGNGTYAFIDLQFRFRVSAIDPGLRIKDVSLSINSALNGPADGANDLGTYILESIGSAAGQNDLGIADVEYSMLDDVVTSNISDSTTFAPRSAIWVTKNILVWSQDTTDSATLNAFEQRFSQAQVPEPGTLALVGIAGLAACLIRRSTAQRSSLASPAASVRRPLWLVRPTNLSVIAQFDGSLIEFDDGVRSHR